MCVELFCDLPEEIAHGVREINSLKVFEAFVVLSIEMMYMLEI